MTYALLRAQSCYSILDSTIEPKMLARAAAERGIPAVALTDRAVLHASLAFSAACLEVGVQPIVGVLLPLLRPVGEGQLRPGQAAPVDGLVLLAQDEEGHRNLLSLVSEAHLAPASPTGPALALDRLAGRTAGLMALTGGADGLCARLAAEGQDFAAFGERLLSLFGDRLFVEIARSGEPVEALSEPALLDWAETRGLPIVGTRVAKFLEPGDHLAHDVMLCIADGAYLESADRRRSNPGQFLADGPAFAALFADLPEAVTNGLLVARRSAYAVGKRAPVLPKLVVDEAEERLALDRLAQDGLARRLAGRAGIDEAPYRERLAFELSVIHRMGFSGYFLIVADFIGWAKARGIPVGPGRGSGAGSVVAWALSITDLDPLQFGLLFERFLNPERRTMPDFDIDFCETRRDEVIRYVQEKYGRERVAQIITFGTLKARAVVKDVGRVLQMPYGEVDRIAKLIPNHPADPWDLERAIRDAPELAAAMADPRVGRLISIARTLEGRPRHSSTHAAGVVIADRPLEELVPLLKDPRSDFPVTQYDLKSSEDAGLVKFDFLGLKTLSVLARAVALLEAQGTTVDLEALPLDDPPTYALLTRGDTVGVFQFESEGMRRALSLVRPTVFEDLIALGALYRPGPMDNIPSFAARKWGREPVDWLHPSLEPILKPTYGIIVYQEQVMQIAGTLAGYSLGEADLLRRAMGKKIKAEMDAQEARFVEGAVARGVDRGQARHIFELVGRFAGYGFNKSHAAAYALVAYQTAFVKAHHPAAFYAATMAYDIADTDKLKLLVDDMRRAGIALLPPDANMSDADFALEPHEGRLGVRYALGALKGVGTAAMEEMVAERRANGPFRSLDDWVGRVEPRALNRRQVEALAAAGVFDPLSANGAADRARLHAGAETLLAAAQGAARERAEGQGGLFGAGSAAPAVPLPPAAPWRLSEALRHERAAFGFYWSGHPVEAHGPLLDAQGVIRSDAVLARRRPAGSAGEGVMMAGIVEAVGWRTPAGRGADRRFLTVDLSDAGGTFGGSCFDPPTQAILVEAAEAAVPLLLSVELAWREGDEAPRLRIVSAARLDEVAGRTRLLFRVRLEEGAVPEDVVARLARLPRGGRSEVLVEVPLGGEGTHAGARRAILRLGRDFRLPGGIDEEFRAMGQVAAAAIESAAGPLRLVA